MVKTLYERLKTLGDKRKRRGGRYRLAALLVMIIVAKLSGVDEVRAMAEWIRYRAASFKPFLALKHDKTPHATTISRVMNSAIDIDALESLVASYFKEQVANDEALAIDGKTLCGTIESGQTRGQHLLALYATESSVVVGQMSVEAKANEIVAAPVLLNSLPLTGRVITGDAMFAQHSLSKQIIEAHGDYLWIVKDNQPSLRAAIARLFTPEKSSDVHSALRTDFQSASSSNKGHGRLEKRCLTSSALLNAYSDWEGIAQVFKIERQVTTLKSGLISLQVEYGLTSLSPERASPADLLRLVRNHWHIENGLHYPRDVSLHEDDCRLRWPTAHRAMAILNNVTLGLIRQLDFPFVPSARRFLDANFLVAIHLLC